VLAIWADYGPSQHRTNRSYTPELNVVGFNLLRTKVLHYLFAQAIDPSLNRQLIYFLNVRCKLDADQSSVE
jgi:hypothetical protein